MIYWMYKFQMVSDHFNYFFINILNIVMMLLFFAQSVVEEEPVLEV